MAEITLAQPRDDKGKFTKTDGTNDADPNAAAPEGGADKGEKGKGKVEDLSGIKSFAADYLELDEKELDQEPGDDADAGGKPPKKADADKGKKGKAADEPPPAKKPAAKPPPAAAPALTRKDVEDVVSGALAKGKEKTDDNKDKPDDRIKDLSTADKRQLNVLNQMSKLWPDKYKDLGQKVLDGKTKLKAYADDWKKKNPGQEFDKDAEEHNDFFEKNDIDWDDGDFDEAREVLITERAKADAKKEIEQELKPKLNEFERKEKLREAATDIAGEQTFAARKFWERAGEDFKDMLDANGAVNVTKLKELHDQDPDLFAIRIGHAEASEEEAAELYKLMNNLTPFLEKKPIGSDYRTVEQYRAASKQFEMQQDLARFMADKEADLLSKPAEERKDAEGREFLPADKYFALPKEGRETYWTFSARDGATMRARWRAAEANRLIKEEEDRFTRRAQHRNLIQKDVNADGKDKGKPAGLDKNEEDEDPQDTDGKPASPSSLATSKLAAKAEQGKASPKTGIETFLEKSLE